MLGRSQDPFHLGAWLVDPTLDTISRGGETLKLEPRMMRLLTCLANSSGAVVSLERLLTDVWAGVVVGPASVYQAISQLRRLLGDTDPEPSYIATVPRKGYRLVAPVRPMVPSPPPPAPAPASPPRAAGAAPRRWVWFGVLVGTALIALIGLAWVPLRRWLQPEGTSASIVVLPFVDMSVEKGDQPFCDGLTEELSNWLAQIPTLRVVARTSAFRFRGLSEDVRFIGKTLNANHVLEGSLRRSGDHLRVTVQLIDARNGYHMWSSEYDHPMEDAIKIQEDIARSVADNLEIRLTQDTAQRFAERRSVSSEAYRLYLLARHYQQDRTRDSNQQAIALYQQSLAADPQFALANVGLAYASINELYLDGRSVADVTATVEPLLARALKLDPDLSELYAVRAALREEQERTDDALADLNHAVALNSNNSWAFAELGRVYSGLGQPRVALQNLMRAIALDPLDYMLPARQCLALQDLARYQQAGVACERARSLQGPGNWAFVASTWLAWTQGNLVEAMNWNASALKDDPHNIDLYQRRADFLLTLGMPAEARQTYEQARTATGNDEAVNIGLAYTAFYAGAASALRSQLSAAKLDESAHARTLIHAARLHLLLGEASQARQLMTRAMQAPDFDAERFNGPWVARWGQSDELILANAELQSGDSAAAAKHLQEIADLLDRLMAAGEERNGIYALRAEILAMRGDAQGAMRDLNRAAELGWRYSWWAQREPYFAALQSRTDFRALIARINSSNDRMRSEVHPVH
ncbi:MAG TPA: winged helix-turn-helix domain-containing protein [Terracidiphilus sp.]|nr:winged helix-turn-helix domain-containing protein [Terracidiphilus sp.]